MISVDSSSLTQIWRPWAGYTDWWDPLLARVRKESEQIKRTKEYGKRTKMGIMLGLGESKEEVLRAMDGWLLMAVMYWYTGQYLQTNQNAPLK